MTQTPYEFRDHNPLEYIQKQSASCTLQVYTCLLFKEQYCKQTVTADPSGKQIC